MSYDERKKVCTKCGAKYWRVDLKSYPWKDQCWTCAKESEAVALESSLQDMVDDECRMPWEKKRKS